MSKAVFCVATNELRAEWIIGQLERGGFSNETVSTLYPEKWITCFCEIAVHQRLKAFRCQPATVSGLTMMRAAREDNRFMAAVFRAYQER